MSTPRILTVGAGPAGLTAAYELGRRGVTTEVVEAEDVVGGISQTVQREGWRFDIGGHRFFTKVRRVEDFWNEILPAEDFLLRPRMSRIFYDGKFFDYPLKASNALGNLGILESAKCVLSYGWTRLRPPKDQTTFEGWVAARFGWRLYRIFFKTYTEKVWGVPATEIQADWAAQRIKNLSLGNAIMNALMPSKNQKEITSLIEEFRYPKYGPGMMWEACAEKVRKQGSTVTLESRVTGIARNPEGGLTATLSEKAGQRTVDVDHVISTMPMQHLIRALGADVPKNVKDAAEGLNYRDFLTIALVVPQEFSFPDNWIYIHSEGVKLGRVQNYGSWSPFMVKDGRTCLGLEYFVDEGDELWEMDDAELVRLGTGELETLDLVKSGAVQQGYIVRIPKAYPVYDGDYARNVDTLREYLAAEWPEIHLIGRNGMHRYNNQDHSMYTAMLTVENILEGQTHDVWEVNVEDEYHEEKGDGARGTGRSAPVFQKA